jgi:hypothetical protein
LPRIILQPHFVRGRGSVRAFRPQMFATDDRTLVTAKVAFARCDRTRSLPSLDLAWRSADGAGGPFYFR